MNRTAIEIRGLTKVLGGKEVVAGLDLKVPAGSLFCMAGPNGSGKTTVLNLVANVLSSSKGKIRVEGKIAYGHQLPHLCEDLSVEENLAFFQDVYAAPEANLALVNNFLKLDPWEKTKAAELSSGMRKRLEVGIALLADADIYLLDEPTAGVDVETTKELLGWFHQLTQTQGKTILLATHELDHFEGKIDYLAVLSEGKKIFDSYGQKKALGKDLVALYNRVLQKKGGRS